MAETTRKVLLFVMIIGLCFLCSGCSFIDGQKEEINDLKLEIEELKAEIQRLEEELDLKNYALSEAARACEDMYGFFYDPNDHDSRDLAEDALSRLGDAVGLGYKASHESPSESEGIYEFLVKAATGKW